MRRLFAGVALCFASSLALSHYYFTRPIPDPTTQTSTTTSQPTVGAPTVTTTWRCVTANGQLVGQAQNTQASAESICGTAVAGDGVTRYLEEVRTTVRPSTSTQTTTEVTRRVEVLGGTGLKIEAPGAPEPAPKPQPEPEPEPQPQPPTGARREADLWPNGTVTSASCNRADVADAINRATHGQRVLIPNGVCTWTSGVTVSKRVLLRAQNYTPTAKGAASRSVTLVNNSAEPLLSFATGNDYHTGLAGIAFQEGANPRGAHIQVEGSGSKVALLSDFTMQVGTRFWPQEPAIQWRALGGVTWNAYVSGTVSSEGAGWVIRSPRAWATASTMGALDTTGSVNVYSEDSTILNASQWPDIEDNGRFVSRYNVLNGTWGVTHGFTSQFGGRHVEYYNNTFSNTTRERNVAQRYFWIRAGTGVFTENVVNNSAFPGEYGSVVQLDIGDNTNPTSYPQQRQPGWGHNGTAHVSDPIYIWNQSGARAYEWHVQSAWESMVRSGRDIFVNAGPKPGYSKYQYPHPLRYAP